MIGGSVLGTGRTRVVVDMESAALEHDGGGLNQPFDGAF